MYVVPVAGVFWLLNPDTVRPITELLKVPVILTVLIEMLTHVPMKFMKLPH